MKKGDTVICIDNTSTNLTLYKKYTIVSIINNYVQQFGKTLVYIKDNAESPELRGYFQTRFVIDRERN